MWKRVCKGACRNTRLKSIIFRSLSLSLLLTCPLTVTVETVEGMGGGHRCAGAKLNSVTQTLLICFCLIKLAQSLGRTEKYFLSTIKRSIIWNVFYVAFNSSCCKSKYRCGIYNLSQEMMVLIHLWENKQQLTKTATTKNQIRWWIYSFVVMRTSNASTHISHYHKQ